MSIPATGTRQRQNENPLHFGRGRRTLRLCADKPIIAQQSAVGRNLSAISFTDCPSLRTHNGTTAAGARRFRWQCDDDLAYFARHWRNCSSSRDELLAGHCAAERIHAGTVVEERVTQNTYSSNLTNPLPRPMTLTFAVEVNKSTRVSQSQQGIGMTTRNHCHAMFTLADFSADKSALSVTRDARPNDMSPVTRKILACMNRQAHKKLQVTASWRRFIGRQIGQCEQHIRRTLFIDWHHGWWLTAFIHIWYIRH